MSEHPYNLLSERVGGRVDLLPHVPDAFWLRLPQFRNEGGRETHEHAHGEMAKVSSSPLRRDFICFPLRRPRVRRVRGERATHTTTG